MLDYKKELLSILENNEISIAPSQELIDSDPNVVRALWKNFSPNSSGESFDFEKWYKECDWATKLKGYSYDVKLWEELLEIKFTSSYYGETSYDFILNPEFKKDFPVIVEHFLNDNSLLEMLFKKTNNHKFYDLLNLDLNKKEAILKSISLQANFKITDELLDRFQNDDEFITVLLENKPYMFAKLSKENKENQKYISLAIKEIDTFKYLSDEKKKENFKDWLEPNLYKIKANHLEGLAPNQKATIFFYNQGLLQSYFSKDNKDNEVVAAVLLNTNLERFVCEFSIDFITEFSKNELNLKKLKPKLALFAGKNIDFTKVKGCLKLIYLIKKFPELQEKLENNPFYELYKINKDKTCKEYLIAKDFEWFKDKTRNIAILFEKEKIKYEEAENFMSLAKKLLSIEVLKEQKLPTNNLFNYMKTIVLKEELESVVEVNRDKSNKKNKV